MAPPQVYKAELPTGETVAVKVQRPNIAKGMAVDFFIVRGLAALADAAITSLNTSLAALVDDFASKVFTELDYVQARPAVYIIYICVAPP